MIPRIPSSEPARALLWLGLLLASAVAWLRPPPAPELVPVWDPAQPVAGCVLAPAGSAPACPCHALRGSLRRALGLPIPLDRARAEDLEALPGIGPLRAAAIVEERAARGGFARVEELDRVHGIGPATIARLQPLVFAGGPDPACK